MEGYNGKDPKKSTLKAFHFFPKNLKKSKLKDKMNLETIF